MPEVVFSSDYFSFERDAHGVGFVRSGDAVLVVPLKDDGTVVLTIEPSPAFGEPTMVLPGGETEEGEPHSDTANRELQEEIGYRAARLDSLGELRPFAKYLAVRVFVFLARGLAASSLEGDEDYDIATEQVPLAGFEPLIAAGRLRDSSSIAALYMARTFLEDHP